MVYKNFKLNVFLKILILSILIFVFIYLLSNTKFYTTSLFVGLLIILQVYLIFQFVTKTNKFLTDFLEAIKYSDFTRSFRIEGLGSSFDNMKDVFNRVIKEFQKIRNEKEEQFYFLQNVIQHIEISMIAYRKNGEVEMFNNATKRLFRKTGLKNIRDLSDQSKELVDALLNLTSGQRLLIKMNDNNEVLQLIIFGKEFKIKDQLIILVSIQNIHKELEEKEIESWQNLIRVLTHEIMNSITPIVSLTATANTIINETREKDLEKSDILSENLEDIQSAMQTINKRSTGLMHFVETYRSLTRIPKPDFKIFYIKEFLDNIYSLLERDLERQNIQFVLKVFPEDLELVADDQLMEQVLINLIKNSCEALQNVENPKIEIDVKLSDRGRLVVEVSDNGDGILENVVDKIFIPFFTTKSEGSGIGLSLSRQILKLHGGTISVNSQPNEGTTMILRF
ncbi:MAG: GHKL domain-containing protein [Bacteroidetes bacterium]|jgi:two-component system, NtrC family, nitrogen regulation sensor histidine kinase NtrY|nr:GHKL domain-containing protein [Bacteroidota bacterium]MBT6685279.1 GHKL domain-containing protein [Bacteroidota bacterium]MBT7141726.1 GHKL domain-containing protein [Bacteroidota bacterium]MBT7491424.1 GHKL domain-containing protein [Bacteroidota bacterium]